MSPQTQWSDANSLSQTPKLSPTMFLYSKIKKISRHKYNYLAVLFCHTRTITFSASMNTVNSTNIHPFSQQNSTIIWCCSCNHSSNNSWPTSRLCLPLCWVIIWLDTESCTWSSLPACSSKVNDGCFNQHRVCTSHRKWQDKPSAKVVIVGFNRLGEFNWCLLWDL